MNTKQKLLAYLSKPTGRNTFSVAQARNLFGFQNVSQRIHELRRDGYPIYTNVRHRSDGTPVAIYRLGTPSKQMKKSARARGIKLQTA